jgi:hypothetical protein
VQNVPAGLERPVSVVVSLRLIVDFIALTGDGWVAYLNRDTGEIISVSDEMRDYVREEVDPAYLPEWQQHLLPKVSEAIGSVSCLPLPNRLRLHGVDLMEQFAYRQANLHVREEILECARVADPFREFQALIYRHSLDQSWSEFQKAGIERIARNWLEMHEIPYS